MKRFVIIGLLILFVLTLSNICVADELQAGNVSPQSNLTLSTSERNNQDTGNASIMLKDRILIAVEKGKPDMLRIGEETTTNVWQQLSSSTVKVMYLFSW